MRSDRSSRTAQHNALLRALESCRPADDRLFYDQLAAELLPWRHRVLERLAHVPPLRRSIVGVIDAWWPGVRSSVVARTRLIDELIAQASGGVAQVVVLGAGLDTRAHRLAEVAEIPVYEVDHPATQRAKRRRLGARSWREGLVFVAHDFRSGGLGAVLRSAGYRADEVTLVIWEGVTNYLSAEEVADTLRWCGQTAPGSHVVFTYVDELVLRDPSAFHGARRALSTVRRAGEEMTFGLAPSGLADHLDRHGLSLRSDVSAAEYRTRYFGPSASSMRGHEFYHVAHAMKPGA